jgi:hypothetical protein
MMPAFEAAMMPTSMVVVIIEEAEREERGYAQSETRMEVIVETRSTVTVPSAIVAPSPAAVPAMCLLYQALVELRYRSITNI